ncbi:hypothetical protein AAC387_Pa06g1583 [Persea americana]
MAASPHDSDSDTQAADLKVGFKVSCWVTAISATGIISVIVGYLGNLSTSLTHKACMLSLSGSFLSGAGLFLLSIIRPNVIGLIPNCPSRHMDLHGIDDPNSGPRYWHYTSDRLDKFCSFHMSFYWVDYYI